ncbi:hypothetical protein [Oceanobacillus oncorhynchi]|uniref:hypothetical protein n=1 Tax=Oceanobacillus oncorhynchi TaxID=545501 RepID=UPI0034D55296
MIKVEKCICKSDFEITEYGGKTGAFTKDEIYFVRKSKKGNITIKSNEGEWICFHSYKIANPFDGVKRHFNKIDEIYFKNVGELRKMSL